MRILPRLLTRLVLATAALATSCREEPPLPQPEPLALSNRSAPAGSIPPALPAAPAPADAPSPSTSASPESPPTPSASPSVPVSDPDALAKKAEICWEDPLCTLEEAARLYTLAADAGAPQIDCFRFYYGVGVPTDHRRARACFERAVKREGGCDDQSPSLSRIYLAAMGIDAQGGPRAIEQARALVSTCFKDMSVQGLLDAADEREGGSAGAEPIDFCKTIGGTTLSMMGCGQLALNKSTFEGQEAMKAIFPRLDGDGRRLAQRAAAAWSAFAEKEADRRSDMYRGGSLVPLAYVNRRAGLEGERAAAIRSLFDHTPGQDDLAAADRELEAARRAEAANAQDAEARKLLASAQAAWRAYRKAEVDLYRRALGKQHGEDVVARDISARLAKQRAAMLREVVDP
jgi:uncharacterized protein YecT (DUF1311 family)